jgi:8-oxo-dGTP pyrophosphatase MutT (NUDIX family)
MPAPWTVENRRTVIDDRFLRVHADRVRTGTGQVLDPFWMVEGWHWACVVPVLPDGRIVCVRQYRHAAGRIACELPAGNLDPDENPVAAAARELAEETGYLASGPFHPLGTLWPEPARSTNRASGFLVAVRPDPGATALDHGEDLAVELRTWAELLDPLQDQLIHGVQVAFLHRARALCDGRGLPP